MGSATHTKAFSSHTHLAGEFYVAAELYKRGFSVALTIGNAKAIDLFAERDTHSVAIQVKTTAKKRGREWTLSRDEIQQRVLYVFVRLNGLNERPSFFVCTPREVESSLKPWGAVAISQANVNEYADRWDKVDAALGRGLGLT